jgi:PAS domain S-box-containing protein
MMHSELNFVLVSVVHGTVWQVPGTTTLASTGTAVTLIVLALVLLGAVVNRRRRARPSEAEALRESEDRFRATFEQAAVGIAHVAPDGQWLRVNQSLCDMLGFSREEVLTRRLHELTHPDDLPAHRANLQRLLAGEVDSYQMEKRYIRSDGTTLQTNVTRSLVRGPRGEPRYFVAIIEDATARHRAVEAQRFLARAGSEFASSLDLGTTLDRVTRFSVPFLGDYCVIYLVDDAMVGHLASIAHTVPAKEAILREIADHFSPQVSNARSPTAAAVRGREPVFLPEVPEGLLEAGASETRYAELLGALGVRSLISMPLVAKGRLRGAMSIGITESGRRFDQRDLEVAEDLASRAAFAIANASLFRITQEAQFQAEEQAVELETQAAELEASNQELEEAVREAEESRAAVESAEAEARALVEAMRDVVLVLDADGRYVKVPPTAPDLLYRPGQELLGKRLHDVMPAAAADSWLAAVRRALETRDAVRYEYSLPIGARTVWFSAVISPMSIDRVVVVARDVTASREAEEALRTSEERYRLLFEKNPMPMYVFDRQTLQFLDVNSATLRQYGYTRDEFLTMTALDIRPPAEADRLRRVVADLPRELYHAGSWRHRRKDGSLLDVQIAGHPLRVAGRDAELILAQDVTLSRRAEAALRENADILRAVVDDSPLAIISVDSELEVTRWNPAAERLLGWKAEEMLGQSFLRVVPEARLEEHHALQDIVLSGKPVTSVATQRHRKDGSLLDVSVSVGALHDAQGEVNGFMVIVADVTEHKRLEEQLRQAQKMEAVGQFAGGVAHDFNNLLTVVTSYSGLMLGELPADDPMREEIQEIAEAADRGASLTRQLLAFSRQQVMQPQVLDLNGIVTGAQKLLRRVIPADIDLVTELDSALGHIHADPGQLEQVLMNLAVNARDAMPEGGTIRIDTANVEFDEETASRHGGVAPGHYVMLSMSDTGTGMTAEQQARIFEPFFTTKEQGKGTGLGLSTVYGIVKQSGGFVWVQSEAGQGTLFRVVLPRVDAPTERRTFAEAGATIARGSATILLAEDESSVRAVARRILERAGYVVLEASNGSEALRLLSLHGATIDLLLTDMVMPNMSGRELATRFRDACPRARVVFMSGYTQDEGLRQSVYEPGSMFIQKPFTPHTLTLKVREALEAAENGGAS